LEEFTFFFDSMEKALRREGLVFVKDHQRSLPALNALLKNSLATLKHLGNFAKTDTERQEAGSRYIHHLQHMILKDVPPHHEHWAVAIDQLRGLRQFDTARVVWLMMEREKVIPDYRLVAVMLRMCTSARRSDWAVEVWDRYCIEAPWLEHNGTDPLPAPPPPHSLDKLSLSELRALPMWMKTHDAHPNLQLKERNRWNVTRDVYLAMCRAMCATGQYEVAWKIFGLMETKLLTTPTPTAMPPPLAEFDKIDQPWQRLKPRHRRKMRATEIMAVEKDALRKFPALQHPWRPARKALDRINQPHVGRGRIATNPEFLHSAYTSIIQECRSDYAQAERYAKRYCTLLEANRRFRNALKANTHALDDALQALDRTQRRAANAVKLAAVIADVVRQMNGAEASGNALQPLDSLEATNTQQQRLVRLRSSKPQLDLLVWRYTLRYGTHTQLTSMLDARQVPEGSRAKFFAYQTRWAHQRPAPGWLISKLMGRIELPLLCKAWLWLKDYQATAVNVIGSLGYPIQEESVDADPYVVSLPDVEGVVQDLRNRLKRRDVITHLLGSLLDVKRAATRNGDAVSSLMRTLTAPKGQVLGPYGHAVASSKMYQTCLMAWLQQLGMHDGPTGSTADSAGASESVSEDENQRAMKKLRSLRLQFSKPEKRAEAVRIGTLAGQLFDELHFLGAKPSPEIHSALLQILAITQPPGSSAFRHFTTHVLHKAPWDSLVAMCVLFECYQLPSKEDRYERAKELVRHMHQYNVKPNDALLDFMDEHKRASKVFGRSAFQTLVIKHEADYRRRLHQSRGNEALVRG